MHNQDSSSPSHKAYTSSNLPPISLKNQSGKNTRRDATTEGGSGFNTDRTVGIGGPSGNSNTVPNNQQQIDSSSQVYQQMYQSPTLTSDRKEAQQSYISPQKPTTLSTSRINDTKYNDSFFHAYSAGAGGRSRSRRKGMDNSPIGKPKGFGQEPGSGSRPGQSWKPTKQSNGAPLNFDFKQQPIQFQQPIQSHQPIQFKQPIQSHQPMQFQQPMQSYHPIQPQPQHQAPKSTVSFNGQKPGGIGVGSYPPSMATYPTPIGMNPNPNNIANYPTINQPLMTNTYNQSNPIQQQPSHINQQPKSPTGQTFSQSPFYPPHSMNTSNVVMGTKPGSFTINANTGGTPNQNYNNKINPGVGVGARAFGTEMIMNKSNTNINLNTNTATMMKNNAGDATYQNGEVVERKITKTIKTTKYDHLGNVIPDQNTIVTTTTYDHPLTQSSHKTRSQAAGAVAAEVTASAAYDQSSSFYQYGYQQKHMYGHEKVSVMEQIERPAYDKLYTAEEEDRRYLALDQDPPTKAGCCVPACWIPLFCCGFILALLGMLCGLGIICAGPIGLLAGGVPLAAVELDPIIVPQSTAPSSMMPAFVPGSNIPNATAPLNVPPSVFVPISGSPSGYEGAVVQPGNIEPNRVPPNFNPLLPIIATGNMTSPNNYTVVPVTPNPYLLNPSPIEPVPSPVEGNQVEPILVAWGGYGPQDYHIPAQIVNSNNTGVNQSGNEGETVTAPTAITGSVTTTSRSATRPVITAPSVPIGYMGTTGSTLASGSEGKGYYVTEKKVTVKSSVADRAVVNNAVFNPVPYSTEVIETNSTVNSTQALTGAPASKDLTQSASFLTQTTELTPSIQPQAIAEQLVQRIDTNNAAPVTIQPSLKASETNENSNLLGQPSTSASAPAPAPVETYYSTVEQSHYPDATSLKTEDSTPITFS